MFLNVIDTLASAVLSHRSLFHPAMLLFLCMVFMLVVYRTDAH